MHDLDTETAQRIDRCAELNEQVKRLADVADDYFHRHLMNIIFEYGDDAQADAAFNVIAMLNSIRDLAAEGESVSRDIILDAGERCQKAALISNPTLM